jgi:hypothetical protein
VLRNNPKMVLRLKAESFVQKIIACILYPFNPRYMESYITVIGDTIWLPSIEQSEENLYQTLVHENIHVKQRNKYGGLIFTLAYLFPLTGAFLAIPLALFLSKWFLLLVGLTLAPLPAVFRFYWEVQAYRTTLILLKFNGTVSQKYFDDVTEWVVKQMASSLYYFTWPFPNHVRKVLLEEKSFNDPIYADLINFLKKYNGPYRS